MQMKYIMYYKLVMVRGHRRYSIVKKNSKNDTLSDSNRTLELLTVILNNILCNIKLILLSFIRNLQGTYYILQIYNNNNIYLFITSLIYTNDYD